MCPSKERGGRRVRTTPCGAARGLAWDCVALRGSSPGTRGAVIGSARPARRLDALRAPECRAVPGGSHRPGALRALSRPFRGLPSSARVAPSATRADRRTTLPSVGFRAVRHMPGRWIRVVGGVLPSRVPRPGFGHPLRGVPHRPSRRRTASERPSACLLEAFSSHRSVVLSDEPALLAFSASNRPLLREAGGRGRLQGFDPDASSFRPPGPRGIRRVDASTRFSPLERSPPASWRRAFHRARSPSPRLRRTSPPGRGIGSCGSSGSARPSRGRRLVRGSSPCDRRGSVPTGAGGGLMASPRSRTRCRRCGTDEPPRHPARPRTSLDPDPPSFGERLLLTLIVGAC